MKEYGIALHTSQRVVGIEPDGVRVVNVNDGTESKIAGDTVLAAFGQKSNTEVADKIYAKYHTKSITSATATRSANPARPSVTASMPRWVCSNATFT